MDEAQEPASFRLAERVASVALELGIESAVIGALALAAHNYVRATSDVDLATSVDVFTQLGSLGERLRAVGLHTELRLPDETDPVGGVLRVWEREDEDGDPVGPVEVVNFRNPYQPRPNPAAEAIRNASAVDGSPLRFVGLPDLVALKLYAGSTKDRGDVVELLVRNPDADLTAIRGLARRYGQLDLLEPLIEEALAARPAHPR